MIRKATILDALEISKLDQRNFVDCLSYEFIYSDLENNPFAYYFVYETNNRIGIYVFGSLDCEKWAYLGGNEVSCKYKTIRRFI